MLDRVEKDAGPGEKVVDAHFDAGASVAVMFCLKGFKDAHFDAGAGVA